MSETTLLYGILASVAGALIAAGLNAGWAVIIGAIFLGTLIGRALAVAERWN